MIEGTGWTPGFTRSVLQACRIVVFATLFLSAASVLRPPSSWQPPANAAPGDARLGFGSARGLAVFGSELNLCPSAFICGYIGFGCGLRGRARSSVASVVVPTSVLGGTRLLDKRTGKPKIIRSLVRTFGTTRVRAVFITRTVPHPPHFAGVSAAAAPVRQCGLQSGLLAILCG